MMGRWEYLIEALEQEIEKEGCVNVTTQSLLDLMRLAEWLSKEAAEADNDCEDIGCRDWERIKT